jgi:hypothetical protein
MSTISGASLPRTRKRKGSGNNVIRSADGRILYEDKE